MTRCRSAVRTATVLAILCATAALPGVTRAASPDAAQPTSRRARRDAESTRGAAFARHQLQSIRDAVDSLKLSDEQSKQIDALFEQAHKDLQTRLSGDQARPGAAIEEMRKDLRSRLQAILDADQKASLEKKMQATRRGNEAAGAPGGDILRRLRDALGQLDLTSDQRQKLQDLQQTNQAKRQEIMALDPAERPAKARELGEESLRQVREILTDKQQEQFRRALQRAERSDSREKKSASPDAKPAKSSAKAGEPSMDETMSMSGASADKADSMMSPEMSKGATNNRAATDARPGKNAEPAAAAGVQIGQPMPDLKLRRLDGRPIQLASYKGKVLVLAFGSYSTPTFRDKAAALDQLAKSYGSRASFLLVYTREAHPVGGWEVQRNKQDEVHVQQHADDTERKAAAEKARGALRLNTLPIVLDTMDNAAADAFGALPAGVVVIGRDGNVLARQKWVEPTSLQRILDTALAAKPTTRPD